MIDDALGFFPYFCTRIYFMKMEQFKNQLHNDLHQFLFSMKEVDERLQQKRFPKFATNIAGTSLP